MSCAFKGCNRPDPWTHDGKKYCAAHVDDALMREDREDFADDWDREARCERELAWAESS